MKEKILKGLKKNWIVIWLSAVVILLGGMVAHAAYTRTTSIKRVVSTQSGESILFSSNYLQLGTASLRNISFTSNKDDPTINLTVCNFAQGKKLKFNDEDITYTLTAELVDKNGNTISDISDDGYYIKTENDKRIFSSANKSYSFERTLKTGDFSTDTFTISFNKKEFDEQKVFMKITATPSSPKDLEPISAIIGVSYIKPDVANWSGKFTDSADSPYKLDGFNYRISGSGKGTVTLSWNTDYIKLGKWAYSDLSVTENDNTQTVTFNVDSSTNNQYNIQFYRTSSPNSSENWVDSKDNISIGGNNFITFAFTADSTE